MIKKLMFTLLFAVLSGQALAEDKELAPAINAADALKKINDILPAQYDYIELLPGKNGKQVYIAEVTTDKPHTLVVIDSMTGHNLTDDYTRTQYSLLDALKFVNTSYAGTVEVAFKEISPEFGVVYVIELFSESEDSHNKTLIVDANSLRVVDTILAEDLEDEEAGFDYLYDRAY